MDLEMLGVTSTEALEARYEAIQGAMRRTQNGAVYSRLGDKLEAVSAELQKRKAQAASQAQGTPSDPYKALTHDMEKGYIAQILSEMTVPSILAIHGIWEILREEFSNEVIERFEQEYPELLPNELRDDLERGYTGIDSGVMVRA